jgi:hypothetical protein
MIIKKTKRNNGFALLFVIVISSIILAIALGVTEIALNEVNFSTSGQATNDAFFAADTGAECAMYWDSPTTAYNAFVNPPSPSVEMSCAGTDFIPAPALVPLQADSTCDYSTGSWSFSIKNLGSSNNACVNVVVGKGNTISTPSVPCTKIISQGYNNANCTSQANTVERELDVNY